MVKVFSRVAQTSRSRLRGQKLQYHVKGLVTRNTNVHNESPITSSKKVMAKVKVFVHTQRPTPIWIGSGDRFLVHTRTVHGGFAVLLRTSCYEFVIMILYCINMLDMKYACWRVDMCCVGWGWIWGKWRHTCPYLGLTKSRVVFVQER